MSVAISTRRRKKNEALCDLEDLRMQTVHERAYPMRTTCTV